MVTVTLTFECGHKKRQDVERLSARDISAVLFYSRVALCPDCERQERENAALEHFPGVDARIEEFPF